MPNKRLNGATVITIENDILENANYENILDRQFCFQD